MDKSTPELGMPYPKSTDPQGVLGTEFAPGGEAIRNKVGAFGAAGRGGLVEVFPSLR